MKKKWFSKEFYGINSITDFLNKLSENGVNPDEIKLGVSGTTNWASPVVWYYSEKIIN